MDEKTQVYWLSRNGLSSNIAKCSVKSKVYSTLFGCCYLALWALVYAMYITHGFSSFTCFVYRVSQDDVSAFVELYNHGLWGAAKIFNSTPSKSF